jgi:hypothetical protein
MDALGLDLRHCSTDDEYRSDNIQIARPLQSPSTVFSSTPNVLVVDFKGISVPPLA